MSPTDSQSLDHQENVNSVFKSRLTTFQGSLKWGGPNLCQLGGAALVAAESPAP